MADCHLDKDEKKSVPLDAVLYQMMNSHAVSRLIYVVAKLGIPDAMDDGAIGSERLAETVGAHPQSLYRVMRTLAGFGLFSEKQKGHFELTPLGRLLRTDAPDSQRALAILMWEPWWRQGWDGLLSSVTTGVTAFDQAHGTDLFDYLKSHPDAADLFNRAMISITKKEINSILSAYDFSDLSPIIDVGGGYGGLIAALLRTYPRMTGIVYDLPHLADTAKRMIEKEGVRDRCTLVAGNFFTSIPSGGDAYILKSVIHDWEDEKALIILKNCRAAMPDKSRLLVIERMIPSGDVPSPAKIMDMVMMVNLGGRERTEEEYGCLLKSSGFRTRRTIPTAIGMNILEALPD